MAIRAATFDSIGITPEQISEARRSRAAEKSMKSAEAIVLMGQARAALDSGDAAAQAGVIDNAMRQMHDTWIRYLEDNQNAPIQKFDDIPVSQVFQHIRFLPQDANKTPDVLKTLPDGRILLGDVATAANVGNTNQVKTSKYFGIKSTLEKYGFQVLNMNFVLSRDLSNLTDTVDQWIKEGILNPYQNIISYRVEHEEINIVMNTIWRDTDKRDEINMIIAESNDKVQQKINWPYKPRDERLVSQRDRVTEGRAMEWAEFLLKEAEKKATEYESDLSNVEKSLKKLDDILKEKNKKFGVEKDRKVKPTIMFVYNTHDAEKNTGYDLIEDYVNDSHSVNCHESLAFIGMMPTNSQLKVMRHWRENYKELRESRFHDPQDRANDALANTQRIQRSEEAKECKVEGFYSYTARCDRSTSPILDRLISKLERRKDNPTPEKAPYTMTLEEVEEIADESENDIDCLGSSSNKPTKKLRQTIKPNTSEEEETKEAEQLVDVYYATNGAQLLFALELFARRILHMQQREFKHWNVFVPANGAMIVIIPPHHADLYSRTLKIPFISICRFSNMTKSKNPCYEIMQRDADYSWLTAGYEYFMTRSYRLPKDKIENFMRNHATCALLSMHLSLRSEVISRNLKKYMGLCSLIAADQRQCPSSLLDLVKYWTVMPRAKMHKISSLITSKLDLFYKARVDCIILNRMIKFLKNYIEVIEDSEELIPKIKMVGGAVGPESLGAKISAPSFCAMDSVHEDISDMLNELHSYMTLKGKKLQGGQQIHKMASDIAEWESDAKEFESDPWTFGGQGLDPSSFNFDNPYSYSKDIVQLCAIKNDIMVGAEKDKVTNRVNKLKIGNKPLHTISSLRGCVKDKKSRKDDRDIHSTSMFETLVRYEDNEYDDQKCTIATAADEALDDPNRWEFSISEKAQRGGARPIATPSLSVKAALTVERVAEAESAPDEGNIIKGGVDKLAALNNAYIAVLTKVATTEGLHLMQSTQDATKFSEIYNTMVMQDFWAASRSMPDEMRCTQICMLKKLRHRIHLFPHINDRNRLEHPDLVEGNGIKLEYGWPQGMLNFISSQVASMAYYVAMKLWKMVKPKSQIFMKHLVNSDDSYMVLCGPDEDEMKVFIVFVRLVNRMVCIKINEKKSYVSRLVGEIVSNVNVNGEAIMITAKGIGGVMGAMPLSGWPKDIEFMVSILQSLIRNGLVISELSQVRRLMETEMWDVYNRSNPNIYPSDVDWDDLPPELHGTLGTVSTFTLAMAGSDAIWKQLKEKYLLESRERSLVLKAVALSKIRNDEQDKVREEAKSRGIAASMVENAEDVEVQKQLGMVSSGEARMAGFLTAIRTAAAVPQGVKKTVKKLKNIPEDIEGTGIPRLVPYPPTFREAVGDLRERANLDMQVAEDKNATARTQRFVRNVIMKQRGATIVLYGQKKLITPAEMVKALDDLVEEADVSVLENLSPVRSEIVDLCTRVRYSAAIEKNREKKKKGISKMPEIYKQAQSASDREVCLMLAGEKISDRYSHGVKSKDALRADARLFEKRFEGVMLTRSRLEAAETIYDYVQRMGRQSKFNSYVLGKGLSLKEFIARFYGKVIDVNNNYNVAMPSLNDAVEDRNKSFIDNLIAIMTLNWRMNQFFSNDIEMLDFFRPDRVVDISRLKPNSSMVDEDTDQTMSNITVDITEYLDSIDTTTLPDSYKLKMAMLQYDFNKKDTEALQIIRQRRFKMTWLLAQNSYRGRDGKAIYRGPFKAQCGERDSIIVIHYYENSFEREVYFESNTLKAFEILNIMHSFAREAFRKATDIAQYRSPNDWDRLYIYNSPNKKLKTKEKMYYLVHTSKYSTEVKSKVPFGRPYIPIVLNRTLNMPGSANEKIAFKIVDDYRGMNVVKDNGEEVRGFTIKKFGWKMDSFTFSFEGYERYYGYSAAEIVSSGVGEAMMTNQVNCIRTENLKESYYTGSSKVLGIITAMTEQMHRLVETEEKVRTLEMEVLNISEQAKEAIRRQNTDWAQAVDTEKLEKDIAEKTEEIDANKKYFEYWEAQVANAEQHGMVRTVISSNQFGEILDSDDEDGNDAFDDDMMYKDFQTNEGDYDADEGFVVSGVIAEEASKAKAPLWLNIQRLILRAQTGYKLSPNHISALISFIGGSDGLIKLALAIEGEAELDNDTEYVSEVEDWLLKGRDKDSMNDEDILYLKYETLSEFADTMVHVEDTYDMKIEPEVADLIVGAGLMKSGIWQYGEINLDVEPVELLRKLPKKVRKVATSLRTKIEFWIEYINTVILKKKANVKQQKQKGRLRIKGRNTKPVSSLAMIDENVVSTIAMAKKKLQVEIDSIVSKDREILEMKSTIAGSVITDISRTVDELEEGDDTSEAASSESS